MVPRKVHVCEEEMKLETGTVGSEMAELVKKRESKESESEESMEYETCEEALWGMTMHLGELQQHAEQCMEDYEMASRMFQDCLDNDLTGEEWECHDYDYWMDKEGRDCAAYEYLGMCEYNYLTIYADEKE
eukprot:UN01607